MIKDTTWFISENYRIFLHIQGLYSKSQKKKTSYNLQWIIQQIKLQIFVKQLQKLMNFLKLSWNEIVNKALE